MTAPASQTIPTSCDPPPPTRIGLTVILLTLLTGLAFGLRMALFAATPDPLGTDGFYYVVQVEDLVGLGRLHVPDSSWVIGWLAAWHTCIADPVLAIKVGACGLAAACVPAAWFAGLTLGRSFGPTPAAGPCAPAGSGVAWALAFWAAASPTLTHLAADFPKSLGLVPPALLLVGFTFSTARRRWRWPAMGLAGLGAASAHRLGAGLLLLAALGVGIGFLSRDRGGAKGKTKIPWLALGLLGGGVVLFGVLSLFLPGLLHPADLERFTGQLDFSWRSPPPFAWFDLRAFHPAQQVELVLPWAVLALGIWSWLRTPSRRIHLAALCLPLLVCLFPFWRRDVLDMGYRLGLMAPLVAVPLAAACLARIRPTAHRLAFPVLLAVGLATAPLARYGVALTDLPPYGRYRGLIDRLPRPLPDLLIAHQGINFLYDHRTGKEAMAWSPEPDLPREGIGRIAWGVRDGEWLALAELNGSAAQPVRLDADYTYCREDVWENLLESALRESDQELLERLADWRNPSRIRPAALMRNRSQ